MGSLRPDAETLAWAESTPHTELFGDIDAPVLAMIGAESYDVMQPAAESIAAAIAHARWTTVAGANHGWQPAAMAAELARFMTECS